MNNIFKKSRKTFSGLILFFFLSGQIFTPSLAQAQVISLPVPGTMVHLSPGFQPPLLKGIKVYPDNPFLFDFILDQGDGKSGNEIEASKLVKYFLACLTTPEKDMWVNLSPYEKDRIVPDSFGRTQMGRDLLAQDYILKQITASLVYPEDELGRKFWDRVSEEAKKKFGTTEIPVNTFNKVWIVPEKAVVYENLQSASAYVIESRLKVMLEEDYLAAQKSEVKFDKTNGLGSQIVREIVIPALTKEVNEGKNFAQLRQIYNSLILAAWYKKKIKDSILSQVYIDKNKVAGVNIEDPNEKQKIYERYLEAFKKGAYNYIKEETDPLTQEMVPKKYFSGGISADLFSASGALEIKSDARVLAASSALVERTKNKVLRMRIVPALRNEVDISESKLHAAEIFEVEEASSPITDESASSAASSAVETHVAAEYKRGDTKYVVDFVLDSDMTAMIHSAGLDAKDFLNEMLAKINSDEALYSRYNLGIRITEYRRLPFEAYHSRIDLTSDYPKEIQNHIPPETFRKLLEISVFKSISRLTTSFDVGIVYDPPVFTDYARDHFSEKEIVSIMEALLQSQASNGIPYEISQLIFPDSGKPNKFFEADFPLFAETHMSTMCRSAKSAALTWLISIEKGKTAPDKAKIAGLKRQLKGMEKQRAVVLKLMQPFYKAVGPQSTAQWREIIASLERAAELDPYSMSLQNDLQTSRELAIKAEQREQGLAEAHVRARTFLTAPAIEVISQIASVLTGENRDEYLAETLFENLAGRNDLSLEEMNFLLTLMPKVPGIDFAKAEIITRRITPLYRKAYVGKLIDRQDFWEGNKAAVKEIYLAGFMESPEQREVRLQKILSPEQMRDFKTSERIFYEIGRNLRAQAVNFNYGFNFGITHFMLWGQKFDIEAALKSTKPRYQNLAAAMEEDEPDYLKLKRAREYFKAMYNIDLSVSFEESTPLIDRPRIIGGRELAQLYSESETPKILERLKVIDAALSRFPTNLVLHNISLQKFRLFKHIRMYTFHALQLENNTVGLDLNSPDLIQVLYHELGHTFHGPAAVSKKLPIYVDYRQVNEFFAKHPALRPDGVGELNQSDDTSAIVWKVIELHYRLRLEEWSSYNRTRFNITNLNDKRMIDERSPYKIMEDFGIWQRRADSEGAPAMNIPYMYEVPWNDAINKRDLVRAEPYEFIAEHTSLYIWAPQDSARIDPVMHDILHMIIGYTVASTSVVSNGTVQPQRSKDVGGIDLNSDKLNLETRSSSGVIRFKVNSGQILEFQNTPGFTPVIINIQPMTSLPVFLGLRQDDSAFKKIGMR